MVLSDSVLKREVMKLSMYQTDRANLWLHIRGFKKGTSIDYLPTTQDYVVTRLFKQKNNLEKFLDKYNLFYIKSNKTDRSKRVNYIVARDKKVAEELFSLFSEKHPHTKKTDYRIGMILGYPKNAVLGFDNLSDKSIRYKINRYARINNNIKKLNIYWEPYILYMAREGYEYEDSLVAKKWADCIRTDLPELAKKIESA